MIITNQLNKNITIKLLKDMTIKTTIQIFIKNILTLYKSPNIITSDRGLQFINDF